MRCSSGVGGIQLALLPCCFPETVSFPFCLTKASRTQSCGPGLAAVCGSLAMAKPTARPPSLLLDYKENEPKLNQSILHKSANSVWSYFLSKSPGCRKQRLCNSKFPGEDTQTPRFGFKILLQFGQAGRSTAAARSSAVNCGEQGQQQNAC